MKRVVPVIIVLILILGIGGSIGWKIYSARFAPTTDYIDYASVIGLEEDEYSITLNSELLQDYRGLAIDGRVYLGMDLVTEILNSRFYWDSNEKVFAYSDQSHIYLFTPDQEEYTIRTWADGTFSDSKDGDEGYKVVCSSGDKYYVAAEYVAENSYMKYAEYSDPNRLLIETKSSWGERQTVTALKETPIRYKGGIKGEVLRMAQKGERMYLIEAYDDWYNVSTDDGYIGWVSTKAFGSPQTVNISGPDYTEPEYTSITRDYKIDMAWHQVMTQAANSDITYTLETAPGINVISPTWFYFTDEDGNVSSIASTDYVTTCHENDIEVWALFSNEFESDTDRTFDSAKTDTVLCYTSKRKTAIEQLMSYVADNGIDGINLDFEIITEDGADDYVEFIRELSVACRSQSIVLSIDNYVPEFTSYYNRKEQGIVADYVVTMCYDETSAGASTAGPVASSSFFSKGITDTIDLVDKSKVIAGLPLFTRVWSISQDGVVTSFACGMTEALGYLTDHGVTPSLQESTGLNYGTYTSDIDNCTYEIWLQDADAVSDEMAMVKNNDIAGSAAWKIGFESGTDIWNIISENLN